MGKIKQFPRCNVLSVRVDDLLHIEVMKQLGDRSPSDYLRVAIEEKIARDSQRAMDHYLRGLDTATVQI